MPPPVGMRPSNVRIINSLPPFGDPWFVAHVVLSLSHATLSFATPYKNEALVCSVQGEPRSSRALAFPGCGGGSIDLEGEVCFSNPTSWSSPC